MTNTPSYFFTHLPNKDPFMVPLETPYVNELDRQLRLDRLSQFFDMLTKKREIISHHINELRTLQEEIKRLDNKI
jgi:hypothetical protein